MPLGFAQRDMPTSGQVSADETPVPIPHHQPSGLTCYAGTLNLVGTMFGVLYITGYWVWFYYLLACTNARAIRERKKLPAGEVSGTAPWRVPTARFLRQKCDGLRDLSRES